MLAALTELHEQADEKETHEAAEVELREYDYIEEPKEVLDFILELMDAEGEIEERSEGEELIVEIETGDDEERLIGHRFGTLESLQYLMGVMRAVAGKDGQVSLDVNGRRADRDSRIREMALKLIDEAQEFGEAVRSRKLLPSERKVIHRLAQEEGGVRTYSIGDELRKIVVLEPEDEEE